MHSLKQAAVPLPGWGHVFLHATPAVTCSTMTWTTDRKLLYFLPAATPNPSLKPQREAQGMLTEPAQADKVVLIGSQVS